MNKPTPRQMEVLRLLADGYTRKEVGKALVIHPSSVDAAVQRLVGKMMVVNITHAVHVAHLQGWLE